MKTFNSLTSGNDSLTINPISWRPPKTFNRRCEKAAWTHIELSRWRAWRQEFTFKAFPSASAPREPIMLSCLPWKIQKMSKLQRKRQWNKLLKLTLRRGQLMESASPSTKAPSSWILLSVQTTLFKNTNIGQHWANSSRPIVHRFCCFSSFDRWFQGFPSGAVVVQGA